MTSTMINHFATKNSKKHYHSRIVLTLIPVKNHEPTLFSYNFKKIFVAKTTCPTKKCLSRKWFYVAVTMHVTCINIIHHGLKKFRKNEHCGQR